MMAFEMAMLIGNIICAIGTLMLINAVIKDRKVLAGYSLNGSILTLVSLFFFSFAFIELEQYLSFGFSLVTISYWFAVVFYLMRRKFK